jgi:ketosteroid isomerase-like protein
LMTRGDDALLELIGPDFEVDFSRRLIDPFVTRIDPDAFASFFSEARETWGELPAWEPEDLIDAGDMVLAFIRFRAKGRASGAQVDVHVANLWTFRDGKPVQLTYFGEDRDAALEAAGLSG